MTKRIFRFLTFSLLALALFPTLSHSQGAGSKSSAPIQVQETEMPGIVAELMEVKRKEGVLTVKVNFRNTGNEQASVNVDTKHGKYPDIYVTGESKKYFVLKDAEGEPLAPRYIQGSPKKGEKVMWWAKFPAPPAEVKKINLIMPKVLPFEDVPITD